MSRAPDHCPAFATWRERSAYSALLASCLTIGAALAGEAPTSGVGKATARSPIRHVIVIIGENRSFDHVFATYQPHAGQSVLNLLSRGIVRADGTPGPRFAEATQMAAVDLDRYSISPQKSYRYRVEPAPSTGPALTVPSDAKPAPFASLAAAEAHEQDLPREAYASLTVGATGLPENSADTRITQHEALQSGPYPLTPALRYRDYAGNPVHRFYQMWQQSDCNVAHASVRNPSGCLNDLYTWVDVSAGEGANGARAPASFTDMTTATGSVALGFYNVQRGDAPYLEQLAEQFTLGDNMHQSVQGGTGPNHIMFGFADAIWYSDAQGRAARPPDKQIENPDPQLGTNDWYVEDGYSGGSYSECADLSAPGVAAVVQYLQSLPRPIASRCEPGHYYLLNNYNPGYNGDGTVNLGPSEFTIPPTSQRHIGDVLTQAQVSFVYYGEGWLLYQADPAITNPYDPYCNICNPFQYATDVMADAVSRNAHIQDTEALYQAIGSDRLPAVAIVKPGLFVDGHPSSSKLDLFEAFTRKIIEQVQSQRKLWAETAIFVTFDEGGGYYDSGYIQPVDFFGDGPRIPLLIVSPYSHGGSVYHGYADHVSIIKFIERNWALPTITGRSRDNYPNPITRPDAPYVPVNSPALSDLWDAFRFPVSATNGH